MERWEARLITLLTPEEQFVFSTGRHCGIGTTKLVTMTLLIAWMAAFVGWLLNPIWAWLGGGLALACQWLVWRRGETIMILGWEAALSKRIRLAEEDVLEVERWLGELGNPDAESSEWLRLIREQRDWEDYRNRRALRAARQMAYARLGEWVVRSKWADRMAGGKP